MVTVKTRGHGSHGSGLARLGTGRVRCLSVLSFRDADERDRAEKGHSILQAKANVCATSSPSTIAKTMADVSKQLKNSRNPANTKKTTIITNSFHYGKVTPSVSNEKIPSVCEICQHIHKTLFIFSQLTAFFSLYFPHSATGHVPKLKFWLEGKQKTRQGKDVLRCLRRESKGPPAASQWRAPSPQKADYFAPKDPGCLPRLCSAGWVWDKGSKTHSWGFLSRCTWCWSKRETGQSLSHLSVRTQQMG